MTKIKSIMVDVDRNIDFDYLYTLSKELEDVDIVFRIPITMFGKECKVEFYDRE